MMHRICSGTLLIALGAVALLQSLDLYQIGLTFWSGLLIYLGAEVIFGSLFKRSGRPSTFGVALGLFVVAAGVLDLMAFHGLAPALTFREMIRVGWPVVLIALGLSVLFKRSCSWHWTW